MVGGGFGIHFLEDAWRDQRSGDIVGMVILAVAAVVGLSIGFSGIALPEGKLDLAGRLYGLGTYALPPFWVAMLVQLLDPTQCLASNTGGVKYSPTAATADSADL